MCRCPYKCVRERGGDELLRNPFSKHLYSRPKVGGWSVRAYTQHLNYITSYHGLPITTSLFIYSSLFRGVKIENSLQGAVGNITACPASYHENFTGRNISSPAQPAGNPSYRFADSGQPADIIWPLMKSGAPEYLTKGESSEKNLGLRTYVSSRWSITRDMYDTYPYLYLYLIYPANLGNRVKRKCPLFSQQPDAHMPIPASVRPEIVWHKGKIPLLGHLR